MAALILLSYHSIALCAHKDNTSAITISFLQVYIS